MEIIMDKMNTTGMQELRGGAVFLTNEPRKAYRIEEGNLLVYLIPFQMGKAGRRLFLGEFKEGDIIPGFASDTEILGSWRIGLVALDTAHFTEVPQGVTEDIIMRFSKTIGLEIPDVSAFAEELIERYNLNTVTEEGYIYATREEAEQTKQRSLRIIYNMFQKGAPEAQDQAASGYVLYDTVAFICKTEKIQIASFDRMRASSGRRFTLNDIARVSHFTIREIALGENWYQRDGGSILAYRQEDGHPFACVPKGPTHYEIYDAATGEKKKLTKEIAETLKVIGFMFYRPFPDEVITARKLVAFGMQKIYPSDIVRLILLMFLGTFVGLLIPYMNEQVYDKFIPLGNANGLMQLGAVILACAMGNITFTIVKNLASFRAMNSMEYAVQSATIDRLFNLPENFLRRYDAADLGNRVLGVSKMYNIIAQSLTNAALSAVFSLLYVWRMFKYSSKMSWWAIAMLAVSMGIVIWTGIRQTRYEREKIEVDKIGNSMIFQFLGGISKLRLSASEDRALYRYLVNFTQSRRINYCKEVMAVGVQTFIGAVQVLFSVVFYYLMLKNNIGLSIGAFTAFTSAFGSFSGAMFTIVQNFLSVNMVIPMFREAKPILETLPESSKDAMLPGDIQGDIELNNITFAYNPEEPPVIQNLSLHFTPGEYVGIVGSSGCGKSTLLKLLMGFEKPQVGKIYYDGQDIDDMDKRELRKKFGVVLQNGGLIAGSIYDNLTITAPGCKMERVQEVVREVGLEEDIKEMPMGLHTVLTEGSSTISGGQAQRMLIARAIMGKPKVIFLDEATSALDNVTQSQVVATLEALPATKIVIAHRLSTVVNCDRIIVMDAGKVVEEGTYQELMERRGRFYELAIRQMA